jgi:flagellar hook-associated protein 3 FlgL
MRSVDDVLWSSYFSNISKRQLHLAEVQNRVGSGKNILRPSDSPGDTIAMMRIMNDRAGTVRQSERMKMSQQFLEHTSNVYERIDETLGEIRSIGMQALSGFTEPAVKRLIADQIDQLTSEIADIAGTHFRGQPVIADFEVKIEENGKTVFKKLDAQQKDQLYVSPISTVEILPEDTLEDALNSISDFTMALRENDDETARQLLSEILVESERIQNENGKLGFRTQYLDNFIIKNNDYITNVDVDRSQIEDVDFAKASLELSQAEIAYNYSMEVASRIQDTLDASTLLKS